MRKLFLSVAVLAAGLVLGGCNVTADDAIKEKVDTYCKLSETSRTVSRAVINTAVAPHAIKINCAIETVAPTAVIETPKRGDIVFKPAVLKASVNPLEGSTVTDDLPPDKFPLLSLAAFAAFFFRLREGDVL